MLLRAICSFTATLLAVPQPYVYRNQSLLETLINTDTAEEDEGALPSLPSWQLACLLAFYAFHQKPGRQSSARVCRLASQAYQDNLHQLDLDCKYAKMVTPVENIEG